VIGARRVERPGRDRDEIDVRAEIDVVDLLVDELNVPFLGRQRSQVRQRQSDEAPRAGLVEMQSRARAIASIVSAIVSIIGWLDDEQTWLRQGLGSFTRPGDAPSGKTDRPPPSCTIFLPLKPFLAGAPTTA